MLSNGALTTRDPSDGREPVVKNERRCTKCGSKARKAAVHVSAVTYEGPLKVDYRSLCFRKHDVAFLVKTRLANSIQKILICAFRAKLCNQATVLRKPLPNVRKGKSEGSPSTCYDDHPVIMASLRRLQRI